MRNTPTKMATAATNSGGQGRAEMERRLIEKSVEDDVFRQRLLADPKGAVEQELGTRLPEGVQVRAVEETQDTIYLVLPGAPRAGREGEALSDQELESVAGGFESTWDVYPETQDAVDCSGQWPDPLS